MAGKKNAGPEGAKKAQAAGARSRLVILDFLRALRDNNDRAWFEAHRGEYEKARSAFEDLVGELIMSFGAVDDLGGVTVKECMFRINRDVRFSNDKSPYKSAMGAVLGRGGRKSTGRSYYLHLEPDGQSLLAGGLHAPTAEELGKMRASLAEDSRAFRKIITTPDFVRYFGALEGESLKTAPQGYPKDHPDIALLRMKQFLAMHPLDDELVASGNLVPEALTVFKAMKPFVVYVERALA
ncbi:MAG: DUF2461 domain-containing protein [Spirochaetota bacterium]